MKPLCVRSFYLFGASLGLVVRGPLFRFVISGSVGLSGVALFDIAMKLTQAARDVVAQGFGVLYPSFSVLVREEDNGKVISLARFSLIVLAAFGGLALGLLSILAGPLVNLWLGDAAPAGLVDAVRLLAIWQFITIF